MGGVTESSYDASTHKVRRGEFQVLGDDRGIEYEASPGRHGRIQDPVAEGASHYDERCPKRLEGQPHRPNLSNSAASGKPGAVHFASCVVLCAPARISPLPRSVEFTDQDLRRIFSGLAKLNVTFTAFIHFALVAEALR